MAKNKQTNEALRYQRLLHGWSQTKVTEEIGASNEISEALIVYQRTPRRWVNEPQVLAKDLFKQNDRRKIDD